MEGVFYRNVRANHHVRIANVSKTYRNSERDVQALADVSLIVGQCEFISIVGTSGCGKSTLLRIISGLDTEYEGMVSVGGRRVTGAGLERGMVFQEHRLLPWLTVEQNMDFALQKGTREEKKALIAYHLKRVGLTGFENFYPSQLSGGMAQRVAIGRAMINRPQVLLLDEPFGALDALTRLKMQQAVLDIWEKEQTAMIMVTHDIEEAVYMGDRVIIMSDRPGTIKKEVSVDLARPRNRSDQAFLQLREEIYREFQENLA